MGKKKVASKVVVLLAFFMVVISGGVITYFFLEYRKAQKTYTQLEQKAIQDQEEKPGRKGGNGVAEEISSPVDFSVLWEVNPDIIAWLWLPGIDISYPVVQGKDNEYYLHRTVDREENFAGSIFMEAANSPDFSDQNTILYGHNMKDQSMFGKLSAFREIETYTENPYIYICIPGKLLKYDIFAGADMPVNGLTYATQYSNEDFQSHINEILAASVTPPKPVEVLETDKIITLSTCVGDGNYAYRFVVQGKLVDQYVVK